MKTTNVVMAAALAATITISGAGAETTTVHASLYSTVAALDKAVFDAFNNCSEPEQLDKHASYFSADVEFYHDKGGVTWTREDMIASTRKNVCGKFSRELIAGSLKVYPVKGFGAIEQGSHRFCQFESGVCEGLADFTMIWREQNGKWEITRVLSYGHRPASEP